MPSFTQKLNNVSYKFTNLSTMTIVEGNLYCLKTTSNEDIQQAAAIIKFKDFVSKPSFEDAPKVFIHHGSSYRIFKKPNAMAHYNKTFLIRAMEVDCNINTESMFEVEGMECYGGRKYVGANCKKVNNQADGIFQLYKPS